MKLQSTLLSGILLFCLPFHVFGQKNTLSNAYLVKTYTFYKNTDPSLNHLNFFDAMAGEMHLSAQSKMVLTDEFTGKNGFSHFKYQQFHEGLPIFGSRYILHEKAGKVVTATGHYSPQAKAHVKPGISAITAIAFAKQAMKANEYDEQMPEPILCFVDPAFPKVSEMLRLSYQVDLQSTEPFDKRRYFVDAATGKITSEFPLIMHEGVPSKAKTKYYGVQDIITDSTAPQQFVLRDLTRGEGIFVYNSDGSNFTNTSSNWDLTNAEMDEVALDAHYCTQEFYDMMLADYDWKGLDGNGKALKAYMHAGYFTSALWSGESAVFGDGDCNSGPLTTLEVVGHEFTHGVVDFSSNLVYSGESGAINESLADIFGKLLERKSDPANFTWAVGLSYSLGPNGKPFRVMDNPNLLEMPAYYKGLYWQDLNDVHTNSSIGNLWFTMLVDGKQGINEVGVPFDVPALGIEKAGQIVFQVNKYYLTENSNYNTFFQFSVEVAESMYGAGSLEVMAVKEAWKAVGLPAAGGSAIDLAISGNGLYDNNFCGLGQYLPIKFNITNLGGIDYAPSMMATVTLKSFTRPDYIINLTSPIGAGEVFEIQVNDWFLATDYGLFGVDATLNFADAGFDNNYYSNFYSVLEFGYGDLSFDVSLSAPKCLATVQNIAIFIDNNSCEAVPAGTSFNFTATDDIGNLFWASQTYTLVEALPGFSSIFVNYDMPVTNSPLDFTLVYPNDPNLLNNEYHTNSQKSYLPITSDYLNDFEINYGKDAYLDLHFTGAITLLYQGSHYFASTGIFQHSDDLQTCPDPLSVFNFEHSNGINASIHTCVDFSFSAAPTLEFDLAQFRNLFTDTSNYQQSSMLQVKWVGNENGNQVIFGLSEGLVQHQNISLPPFFKGALDLKLYTELGHWGLDPNQLGEDDFVLLDNLKLSAPTSGTTALTTDPSILVSPNPARETTTIQALDGIKTILLQNVSGQTLQTWQVNATRYDVDLKNLANGFYLLNIQLENGQCRVKKLVKMEG
ncbi:MAG: M4 family metallopeptidase [Phycisphaerae bacterium]|nr:M4 family metallopeptidase [Saprospiraceae bacterium]